MIEFVGKIVLLLGLSILIISTIIASKSLLFATIDFWKFFMSLLFGFVGFALILVGGWISKDE